LEVILRMVMESNEIINFSQSVRGWSFHKLRSTSDQSAAGEELNQTQQDGK
jgi:hypothetical protein